jgi:hypothetical protein
MAEIEKTRMLITPFGTACARQTLNAKSNDF